MKITINQYAKTLFEVTENKSAQEVDEAVLNFAQIVRKNRQSKLFPKILENFSTIWNSANKIVEVDVTSKEKLGVESENKIVEYIKKKYKAETVVINNKIDKNIIGGIILKVGDEVMDQSIKGQLKKLRNNLIK